MAYTFKFQKPDKTVFQKAGAWVKKNENQKKENEESYTYQPAPTPTPVPQESENKTTEIREAPTAPPVQAKPVTVMESITSAPSTEFAGAPERAKVLSVPNSDNPIFLSQSRDLTQAERDAISSAKSFLATASPIEAYSWAKAKGIYPPDKNVPAFTTNGQAAQPKENAPTAPPVQAKPVTVMESITSPAEQNEPETNLAFDWRSVRPTRKVINHTMAQNKTPVTPVQNSVWDGDYSNLPKGSVVFKPSYGQIVDDNHKPMVGVKLPFRPEGYTEDELRALGQVKASYGDLTNVNKFYGKPNGFEGYYYHNGKYYPVDMNKAAQYFGRKRDTGGHSGGYSWGGGSHHGGGNQNSGTSGANSGSGNSPQNLDLYYNINKNWNF